MNVNFVLWAFREVARSDRMQQSLSLFVVVGLVGGAVTKSLEAFGVAVLAGVGFYLFWTALFSLSGTAREGFRETRASKNVGGS
jgi:hypothetical protein